MAIASGLAYVVDGKFGLQVVNYLAFDQGKTPPEITLRVLNTDIDPARPGIQMPEASTVTLSARITDDVQVRNVELLVDGVIVRNEVTYPYDFTTTLPTIVQTGAEAVLQIRATDTGGNVRLSDPVVIELVPDNTAPTILQLDPVDDSTEPLSRRRVTIRFSEPLDRTTVTAANFELLGPAGVVPPLSVSLRQQDTQVELYYAPLAEGNYQLVIHAAAVTDRVGNALGAGDSVSSFRIATIVHEPTIRWINAGRRFLGRCGQLAGRPPAGSRADDVLIDMAGDADDYFPPGRCADPQSRFRESAEHHRGTAGRQRDDPSQRHVYAARRQRPKHRHAQRHSTPRQRRPGADNRWPQPPRSGDHQDRHDAQRARHAAADRRRAGAVRDGHAGGTTRPIGFEGSQEVTSGTFVFAGLTGAPTFGGRPSCPASNPSELMSHLILAKT